MNITETIIEYLKRTYSPHTILLYGSYMRGDNDESSDFDCIVITDKKEKKHDSSVIENVRLDCFIYTDEEIETKSTDTFLAAYDCKIVLDNGTGKRLKERVENYVQSHTKTDEQEKKFIASWARKTLERIKKGDDEGSFRAVWLFTESLSDYFTLRDMFYFGSKKAIRYLKENDEKGYALFHKAAFERTNEAIENWVRYVIEKV